MPSPPAADPVPSAEEPLPPAEAPLFAPTLQRLLRLARARPDSRVCVCGSQGLDVLLALNRLGYARACCISAELCGCGGDDPYDLLLLTGPMAPAAMASALARALPHLSEGGVLAASEAGLQDDALILQVLAACGRVPGWRIHDMSEGCLVALQVVRADAEALQRAA